MTDKQTTGLAWRVFDNRFVQIGLLIAAIMFSLPPTVHAGMSSADWLCKAMGIMP